MNYATGENLTDKLVWGEGCDDTLHFDCGGFVRYVVRQVCGVSVAGINGRPDPQPLGTLVAQGDPVLPADILVYDGHIAFATGEDTIPYSKTSFYHLAQAESATEGVNYGKLHKSQNVKCIRLSESVLLGRA